MTITDLGAFRSEPADEADLVRRAKARDALVWASWHDQYYPLIYRYAYSRLSSRSDAEDVASQVFLEAMKSIGRYDYRGRPILAWFYGIASHVVSKRRRQLGRSEQLPDMELLLDTQKLITIEDASLTRVMLYEALSRLKPEHRDVLVLRFLLDLPSSQVAEILGKSEAATYSLQVRAMNALRRDLSFAPNDSSATAA